MQFSFSEALRTLGPDAAFRLINGARTPASYLGSQFLPERSMPTYTVESGSMTIRPLMAGLAGMDSPYPEQTAIDSSTFLEKSAKIANAVTLPEQALRRLQLFLAQRGLSGAGSTEAMAEEALNFTNALLVQPHLDTAEYLRWQCLLGLIDWTFNAKRLLIDYAIPAANKPAQRTGTAKYGGTASVFWADNQLALNLLKYNRQAVVMHPDTFNAIISNPVNNLTVVSSGGVAGLGQYNVIKMDTQNGVRIQSADFRDQIGITTYGLEAEVLDPANPGGPTIRIPFLKPGKVVHIGASGTPGYVVGAGSQQSPVGPTLGYTHVAPTVEGGGQPGRWARVYTPEGRPWELRGEGVQNMLPVLEEPTKIVVFDTVVP